MKRRREKIITKARRPNFTNKEVNVLLREVSQDPELSRGEVGGSYQTTLELRKRWDEIALKINSVEIMERTGDEIKNKFLDMKTKTKKKAAEIEKYREETGGDNPSLSLTDIEKTVLAILEGEKFVTGMPEAAVAADIPELVIKTESEMPEFDNKNNVLQPRLDEHILKTEKHDLLKKESMTKARRPKFTLKELNVLLEEVSQNPQLSRGELGGAYKTSLELRNKWDEIACKINSLENMERTGEEVKSKFGDMKTKTKKKAAEIERYREETGGDEPNLSLTDVEAKVLRIIGKTVEGDIKPKIFTNKRPQSDRKNTPLKRKNKHILKKRNHDLLTRNLLANQKSILKQMQLTNLFLRKLVVLKKKEVELISTNTFM